MAVKNGWLANPRDKADALKTRDMETRRGRGRRGGGDTRTAQEEEEDGCS